MKDEKIEKVEYKKIKDAEPLNPSELRDLKEIVEKNGEKMTEDFITVMIKGGKVKKLKLKKI